MTTVWPNTARDTVLSRIACASEVVCFLDFDGTLAPLAPTPDQATPLPGMSEVLAQLARAPNVDVVIVTGRTIADVRPRLDVPAVTYVGLHGLEVCKANGAVHLTADPTIVRSVLPRIKQRFEQVLGMRNGLLLEDKGAALACHHRLASPPDAAAALTFMDDVVRYYQERGVPLTLTYGHEVVEIRLAGVDKGHAVCAVLSTHAAGCLPIYIGDDQTDEDAFAILPLDSITVRVGPCSRTCARYGIATPAGVLRFLRAVAEHRASGCEEWARL